MIKNLTPLQVDALREVGNIGSGNAATALAQFLDRKIDMKVPDIKVLPLEELPVMLGGEEKVIACILLRVLGEASGNILFLMEEHCMYNFLSMVFPQRKIYEIGELEKSAMKEVGNILAGSFLNAINRITNFNCIQSLPSFAMDMAGAVLTTALLQSGVTGSDVLFIETKFSEGDRDFLTNFFLVPDPGSLEKILESIGVDSHEEDNPGKDG